MRHLGAVTRALAMARATKRGAQGAPPPLAGHGGIGRRALLRNFALMLAASGCAPAGRGPTLTGEVAIIGGGIAGLTALDRLTQAGIPARLYEARPRSGGRMLTRADFPAPGRWVEMGGQLINTDHADMIALARQFDLPLLDVKAGGGADQVLIGGRMLDPADLSEALAPIADQIAADSARLDAEWEAAAAMLDALSVADYLDRHADRIALPEVRALLEQSIRTEFGVEPGAASALLLIFNLPTVDGADYEVLGASDERFIIAGGSQRLTDALAQRHAEHIVTGARLTAIARAPGGMTRLQFARGDAVEASHVILAVPAGLLGGIAADGVFAAPWQAFHREVRLGRNGKLNAAYGAAPWRASAMGKAGATWQAGPDPQFCEAWEAAPAQPGTEAALTWYFGGDLIERMDEGTPAAAMAQVHQSFGAGLGDLAGAFTGTALRTTWHRDPLTGGAYSAFAPGQLTRFAGQFWVEGEDGAIVQEARDGTIWFAGEHLSDAFAGYMNGGAQTGRLAADALAAALG